MSNKFQIAETETFSKNIVKNKFSFLYPKIREYIYPILKENPFFGPNIKKLKGNFANYYRYRIGKYRLFYAIDQKKIMVYIINIKDS